MPQHPSFSLLLPGGQKARSALIAIDSSNPGKQQQQQLLLLVQITRPDQESTFEEINHFSVKDDRGRAGQGRLVL
jgi:hypothetical protein